MFCLSYANLVHSNSGCLVVMWPADARAFSRPTFKAREERPGDEVVSFLLISHRAGAWYYRNFPDFLKSPVSKWWIVRVRTRTKAFFFEEIVINLPSENLPGLSKERMQYFCHALKLTLKSRHSASASNCSMNRSAPTKERGEVQNWEEGEIRAKM